jgi:hypothetical protein
VKQYRFRNRDGELYKVIDDDGIVTGYKWSIWLSYWERLIKRYNTIDEALKEFKDEAV